MNNQPFDTDGTHPVDDDPWKLHEKSGAWRTGICHCRKTPEHVWHGVIPADANCLELECPQGCGITGFMVGIDDPVYLRELYERLRKQVQPQPN